MKRKSRKSSYTGTLLKPVDLKKIGSKNDPCFGKHYDLKAPECNMCGAVELCGIAYAQKLSIERFEQEKKLEYLDLQPTFNIPEIRTYFKKKLKKYGDEKKAKRLTKKKFNLSSKNLKQIYNEINS